MKRPHIISVRITDEEKQELRTLRGKQSISELLREALEAYLLREAA